MRRPLLSLAPNSGNLSVIAGMRPVAIATARTTYFKQAAPAPQELTHVTDDRSAPERPRAEPEIIPPDRDPGRPAWRRSAFPDIGGTQRIYVTRIGPFGGILLLLAVFVLAAVVLLAVLGALIIWIPIVGLIVLVAALSGFLRLRRW